ncbi:hypothetical protein E4U21_001423 [Claviceps maximensis]|nr:hypothetical protein E4U21_001423 [Claviceps maximensis]
MINSSPTQTVDAATARQVALPASASTLANLTSSTLARSTSTCTSATGTKRAAPSLLPAFEPLSSSPGLPRPLKRQNTGQAHLKYPTPVPTSSTGILSSSPPRARSDLARSVSGRAPLSSVPAVELPENGHMVAMGRSSNSSQFQLSANRLVSRVHVKARYIPAPSPLETNKIEVVCNGWNGLKLHCQGRTWELFKGDSFTSETEGTDLIVDVLDARVMIQWPKRGAMTAESLANLSDSSWDDSPPRSQLRSNSLLQSSPLRRNTRITSPESPTPVGGNLASSQRLQALLPNMAGVGDDGIHIFEDDLELPEPRRDSIAAVDVGASMVTNATASFSSELSDVDDENEHDPDEENDPVVHSFGPFGANLTGRLASVSTKSPRPPKPLGRPQQCRRPHHASSNETLSTADLSSTPSSPTKESVSGSESSVSLPVAAIKVSDEQVSSSSSSSSSSRCPSAALASTTTAVPQEEADKPTPSIEVAPAVINHVINQLAFSRLASTPLSTIMQNLPNEHKSGLTKDVLRVTIEAAPCIGIIPRQGKDAAGKALESEYYYQPDEDHDIQRRSVVDAMRKPSLRNCRKQHKQYYWKRPRTP